MPPLAGTPLLHSLIGRDTIVAASNTTIAPPQVQVVCAWPVSGQYGFGTRILYYILVATCVLARRKEWLRNACLAAALLLPAVAAIHAIVLAAVHVNTAVDMDIYGAFQICSIGILAAPITVYNSKTYFNDPGRNIIFLWTGLLLAGMLSLTIEFFRIETFPCSFDDMGALIDPLNFPYTNAGCGLNCEFGGVGPYSPIRQDPTNEPAVIPVPERLTFNAVTLLAAASSIPPVLTLIFTWEKILEINWKRRFGRETVRINDPIEGTNGATPRMISFINDAIRNFLSSIQIPIFSGIVVVLLVIGEVNFWSTQVFFQAEPFSSVGQWANVVATVLVVLGSLVYVRNEREVDGKEDVKSNHSHDMESPGALHTPPGDGNLGIIHDNALASPTQINPDQAINQNTIDHEVPRDTRPEEATRESIELRTVATDATHEPVPLSISNKHRHKVATLLNQVGEYLGTPAPDRYDNSVFSQGKAEFPEIPGEAGRVANLEVIRDRYRSSRQQDDEESFIPGLSRAESISSIRIAERGPANRDTSPSRSARSPSRSNTTPVEQNEYPTARLDRATTLSGPSRRVRRDTLEVPSQPKPAHIRLRNGSSSSTPSPTRILDTQGSPKIVVSAEPEDTTPTTPTRHDSPPRPP